jgi:hypothetical protein
LSLAKRTTELPKEKVASELSVAGWTFGTEVFCSDKADRNGCIFTQKLMVFDATPAEIDAAVGGGVPAENNPIPDTSNTDCKAIPVTMTITDATPSAPTATLAAV